MFSCFINLARIALLANIITLFTKKQRLRTAIFVNI